jgi:hypothetical protein
MAAGARAPAASGARGSGSLFPVTGAVRYRGAVGAGVTGRTIRGTIGRRRGISPGFTRPGRTRPGVSGAWKRGLGIPAGAGKVPGKITPGVITLPVRGSTTPVDGAGAPGTSGCVWSGDWLRTSGVPGVVGAAPGSPAPGATTDWLRGSARPGVTTDCARGSATPGAGTDWNRGSATPAPGTGAARAVPRSTNPAPPAATPVSTVAPAWKRGSVVVV